MFIPQIAREIFPEWNISKISYPFLIDFCKKQKVFVIEGEDEQVAFGEYIIRDGYEFILINKHLPKIMKLWVLCHEVFHWRVHRPETSNFSTTMEDKNEAEANIFAAVAILPRTLIEGLTVDEISKITQLPLELIQIRKMIADNFHF